MRKMITLFQRNYGSDDLARNEVMPGAEWVLAGEGLATRKHDGTCCMVRDGRLYKRYDAKGGKPTPVGFEPAQEPDQRTGHWPGWVPVGDGPDDRWFREAFDASPGIPDGTYELCGPKVQGNPEKCETHVLIRHGSHFSQFLTFASGKWMSAASMRDLAMAGGQSRSSIQVRRVSSTIVSDQRG